MTMSDTAIPSLADRVRTVAMDSQVVAVHFVDRSPVFVLSEETLLFAEGER